MKISLIRKDGSRKLIETESVLEVLNAVHASDIISFEHMEEKNNLLIGPTPHLVQTRFAIHSSALIHPEIAAVWGILDDGQKETYLMMTDQDAGGLSATGGIDWTDATLLETLDLTPYDEWNKP